VPSAKASINISTGKQRVFLLPARLLPPKIGSYKMFKNWKEIPAHEARSHILYGIKGWLAVFMFVIMMSTLGEIGRINLEAQAIGLTLSQLFATDTPAATAYKIIIILDLIVFVAIGWLIAYKHIMFRIAASAIMIARCLVVLLIGILTPVPEIGGALAIDFITLTFWSVVWIIYLHRSERVRITFENRVLHAK